MRRRYLSLLLGLTTLLTLRFAVEVVSVGYSALSDSSAVRTVDIARNLQAADAESVLARGEKLCFWVADHSSLILIPGVGDTLAARLLISKESLLSLLEKGTMHPLHALQTVKGIGKQTAKKLSRYLDFLYPPNCIPRNVLGKDRDILGDTNPGV